MYNSKSGSNIYRHHASALKFRVCSLTAALIKFMEVLYIQNMTVLLYNQVYSTEIFIFRPEASAGIDIKVLFVKVTVF